MFGCLYNILLSLITFCCCCHALKIVRDVIRLLLFLVLLFKNLQLWKTNFTVYFNKLLF